MIADYTFTSGEFQSFRSIKKLHLGRIGGDLPANSIVEYDGSILRYGKKELEYPEVIAILRMGWLIPADAASVSEALAQQAADAARVPTPPVRKVSTISHEQQEVGQVSQQHSQTQRSNSITTSGTKPFNSTLVVDGEGEGRTVGPSHRTAATSARTTVNVEDNRTVGQVSAARSGRFDVTKMSSPDPDPVSPVVSPSQRAVAGSRTSSEDGRVVGTFKPTTNTRVVVADASAADREMRKINSSKSTAQVLMPKGSRQIMAVESDDIGDLIDALDPATQGRVVSKVSKAAAAQALRARQNAEYELALQEAAKEAAEQGQVAEPAEAIQDIEFETEATEAPVLPEVKIKVIPPQTIEELLVMGDDVQISPGFTWNKKLHWKTRAKLAMEIFTTNENGEGAKRLAQIRAYEEKVVVAAIDAMLQAYLKKKAASDSQDQSL